MNTIKYRAFVEAVRCGNLTTAAQNLNYTQSGISHMINSLEREYGFPLLHRLKNGVCLTDNGKYIYDIYKDILDLEEMLNLTVNQIKGAVIGKIRVGAFFSVISQMMPDIIRTFSEECPQIDIILYECEIREQLEMLTSNRIDIGILSGPVPDRYCFYPLREDEIVAIVPRRHVLAERAYVTPEELLHFQRELILPHESINENIRLVYGNDPPASVGKYSAGNEPTIISLVSEGLGIGIVPRLLLRSVMSDIAICPFHPPINRTLGLVTLPEKASFPIIKRFIDLMCRRYSGF